MTTLPAPEPSPAPTGWRERRVIAYAHQGGAWEGPSSTLHAIGAALDAGATGIELDVHATADGRLVVCHDATVDRTSPAAGAIASLTYEELARLDNAYWWAPGADVTPGLADDGYPFRGRAPGDHRFGFALLEEVLEEFPGTVLNLDIKQTAPVVAPYEEDLAVLLRRFDCADRVIVASFLDTATDAFSAFAPEFATSAGTVATADFYRAVRAGEQPPPMRHVALQVPVSFGDLTAGRRALRRGGPPPGAGRARVDDRSRVRDGGPVRPRGRRDHHRPSDRPGRGPGPPGVRVDPRGLRDRPVAGVRGRAATGRGARRDAGGGGTCRSGANGPDRRSGPGGGRAADGRTRTGSGQPRPQFGFLPWLAFFLARSLRLLVRFDTVRQGYSLPVATGQRGGRPGLRHGRPGGGRRDLAAPGR